jgi:hypothetical protein
MIFRACLNRPYLRPHYFSIYSCRSRLCAGKSRTLSQLRRSSGCWKSVTLLATWGNSLSKLWRAEHGVGGPAERRIPCYDSVGLAARWRLLATKRQTVRSIPHFSFRLPHVSVDMVLETLKVDFKPLHQSIHIYTTLDSLDELRKSYQADRKVRSSKRTLYPLLTI